MSTVVAPSLLCPADVESATEVFDPAGYDADDCAGCGCPRAEHWTDPRADVQWRGITLWDPWGSLVACGAKPSETRDWGTSPGPLLIHVARRWKPDQQSQWAIAERVLRDHTPQFHLPTRPPLGCIVALVDLVRCERGGEPVGELDARFGSFGPDRVAWRLANVRLLVEPIPWPGAMGAWAVPEELRWKVLREIGT